MFELQNAQSLAGIAATIAICWALSEKRRAFPWKLALGAVAVQAALVMLLFGAPSARAVLGGASQAVDGLSTSTQAGVTFVFGFLAGGEQPYPVTNPGGLFVFAFRVLPVILVICAVGAALALANPEVGHASLRLRLRAHDGPARAAGAGDGGDRVHGPGRGPDLHPQLPAGAL